MAKTLYKTIISLLCIVSMMIIIPTQGAHALQVEVENMKHIPAVLGGQVHGTKSSTFTVEGKGIVTTTINYDTGKIVILNYDGQIIVSDLVSTVEKLAKQIQKLTPDQKRDLISFSATRSNKKNSDLCRAVLDIISALQAGALGLATTIMTANPFLGWLVAGGNVALFNWFKGHC